MTFGMRCTCQGRGSVSYASHLLRFSEFCIRKVT